MTLVRFAFLECLRRLRWTIPAILLVTAAAMYAWPEPPGIGGERTAALWLHIPSFLACAAVLSAAIEVWPLFARGRPGGDYLARLRPGPLGGCGAVCAGALAALGLWLVGLGAAFAGVMALGTELRPLHSQHRLTADPVFLDAERSELRLAGPGDAMVGAILMRPQSVLPAGGAFATTSVKIAADGTDLHDGWIQLGGQLEDHRVSFPPRRIDLLQIRRQGAGAPLMFGPDAIRAESAAPHSWVLGCVVGATSYLFPAALAMAMACLLRQRLAMSIVVVGMLAVLIASSVTDLTPNGDAITALTRGRWFLSEAALGRIAPSAAVIGAALALAAATGIRGRR